MQLPSLPTANRQGRGWNVISSLLMSGALIGGSFLVNRSSGGSLIYLIPMAVGAAVFLLISMVQLVQDYWRRWRDSVKYAAALRATTLHLIQQYTDQQFIRYLIDPELTAREASKRVAECDKEQSELIARFIPCSLLQRILRRSLVPAQLGLHTFSERQIQAQAASLLDIAGCDADVTIRMMPRSRLWERRPHDPDFLALKLGATDQPATVKIEAPPSVEQPLHVEALIERFATLRDVPLTVALPQIGSLGVAGPRKLTVRCTHALIWQIATHHAPSEVRVAAIYRSDWRDEWSWLRWLPHCFPLNGDRQRRMIAVSEAQIEQLLLYLIDELSRRRDRADEDTHPPRIVLLIDGDANIQQSTVIKELLRQGKTYGMHIITLADDWELIPSDCGAMLRVNSDGTSAYVQAGSEWSKPFRMLQADVDRSDLLSRALRPFVLAEMGGSQEIPREVRLLDLLRTSIQSEINLNAQWKEPISGAWHPNVPIGRTGGGVPVYLDLREHHDGPHGIIAGKTGAGKSELLQSLIAAIAATHAPDRAQFMLIDFKGGASLRAFEHLPHTVGLVTDLQDSRLAERAITAMRSELKRRKDVLNEMNVQDIASYRALPAERQVKPLANLLIVIDEFDTMVKEQPGFVNELITVVKQGRSLGVHLLVASQEPSGAVKDEIKRQLQYWIALRLGSTQDSREMLQRPDAFYLPPEIPGRAYMRVGTESTLFQAARVSSPFQLRSDDDQDDFIEIDPLTGAALPRQGAVQSSDTNPDGSQRKDLDFLIEQIRLAGESYLMQRIWRPPLPVRLTLTQREPQEWQVLPETILRAVYTKKWWSINRDERLNVPIGLLDIPQESRQDVATLNLATSHVLVLGAPGSGKTMLLRTLLLSLAITHRPSDVWCYIIDAGGQGLSAFRNLPHVGGLVQVRDVDQVRRVIALIKRTLEEREKQQREAEQDTSPTHKDTYRESMPALLVIVDKFALFREEYEDLGLIDDLLGLASQGRSYDIHLVITADRPSDVPYRLQGLFDTRLLLRLTDESDALTMTGRRDAAQISLDRPGRGYQLSTIKDGLNFRQHYHTSRRWRNSWSLMLSTTYSMAKLLPNCVHG